MIALRSPFKKKNAMKKQTNIPILFFTWQQHGQRSFVTALSLFAGVDDIIQKSKA